MKEKFKKGDFIGQKYEVYDVLGEGGFGIVYLVYVHKTKSVYALKTFRDEYLEDEQTRNRFRKEAEVWINLERHPYLVRAYLVDEISGRLYIVMEHIVSDEQGLNSLDAYLKRRPPDLAQNLRWAIQFCYGMEYAYSKGIRAHRDIKPSNIMIDQNKNVKISDFGLAGIFQQERIISEQGIIPVKTKNDMPMQTAMGTSIGTPEYMSPEQFTDFSACDERSDIYSFGVVLYQTASGGRLPFTTDNPAYRWTALKHFHHETPVPKLNSPLFSVILRCLEKEPEQRYQAFRELRADIELLLKRETGKIVKLPELKELEAWGLVNKGYSLLNLGKPQEAIACFDRALEINLKYADAWVNKGVSLSKLGKYQEAIACYDKALNINPGLAEAWVNKGNSLGKLGKDQEAIVCFDKALEINPGHVNAWANKGRFLGMLSKYQESIVCFDKALEINPRFAEAWVYKGVSLSKLGKYQEAIACYDRALEINPRFAEAWVYKGNSLGKLGKYQEAITCYDKALEINPGDAETWYIKGNSLIALSKTQEAIACYDKALEINPKYADAWYIKAFVEEMFGSRQAATLSYKKFIDLKPTQYADQIENARKRLKELEEK